MAELVDPLELERRFSRAESYENLHAQACTILREKLTVDAISELAQSSERVLAYALDSKVKREVCWASVSVVDYERHDEHGAMSRTISILQDALWADEAQDEVGPDGIVRLM